MNARTVPTNPGKSRHESLPESTLVLDLGTSRLRAALLIEGRPRVIDWPELGKDVHGVPVVIGLDPEPPRIVLGDEARRLMLTEPSSMIEASPRLLGVRAELAGLAEGGIWRSIPVGRGRGGDVQLELDDDRWPAPRLIAVLLQNLAHRIERRFALTIERTLVMVAPGADDPRRRALLHALRIAGLPEPALVHSTTAAGLAWWTLEREGQAALGILGLEAMLSRELDLVKPSEPDPEEASDDEDDDEPSATQASEEGEEEAEAEAEAEAEEEPEPASERTILLFDLGAGSFDAALLRLDGSSVEVIGARSRIDVGGIDLDERIVDWLFEQFEAANEIDLSGDALVRARIRDVAEKAKIALTDAERFEVRLPFLWADASGPKHLFCTLERARFERMIHDLVEVPAALARELMADAGLGPDELDAVVMLGGSSRVPVVQDRIEALIGRVPETELGNRQLDEDFSLRGAALEARRRGRRRPDTRVVELATQGVWLRSPRGPAKLLIERGTVLPAAASVKLAVDTSVGLGWNDAHELWQSDESGEFDESAWARAEQFQAALGFRLGGERAEVEVHVELDLDGCLGVRIDERVRGKEAFIRVERRPGLSERALRRFVAEARDRAYQTALHDRFDAVRRAVSELVRTIEGWFADPKSGLDELVKTSLTDWNRDAEAVLAHGQIEPMLMALEVFDTLIGALPAKLREGVSGRTSVATLPEPVEGGTIETPPEDDYTTTDVLALLAGWEVEAAEVEEAEEAELEEPSGEVEDAELEEAEAELEEPSAEVEAEELELAEAEVPSSEAEEAEEAELELAEAEPSTEVEEAEASVEFEAEEPLAESEAHEVEVEQAEVEAVEVEAVEVAATEATEVEAVEVATEVEAVEVAEVEAAEVAATEATEVEAVEVAAAEDVEVEAAEVEAVEAAEVEAVEAAEVEAAEVEAVEAAEVEAVEVEAAEVEAVEVAEVEVEAVEAAEVEAAAFAVAEVAAPEAAEASDMPDPAAAEVEAAEMQSEAETAPIEAEQTPEQAAAELARLAAEAEEREFEALLAEEALLEAEAEARAQLAAAEPEPGPEPNDPSEAPADEPEPEPT